MAPLFDTWFRRWPVVVAAGLVLLLAGSLAALSAPGRRPLRVTAASSVARPVDPGRLLVGVGRADITPPTGFFLQGWVRSDSVGNGQATRLFARAVVLQLGHRKLALVAEDLNGIAGGMLMAAADRLRSRGFSQRNVLDSASHTHGAPSGYFNFSSYNTVFMTKGTPTQQNVQGSLSPQLYAFEVRRLALAIRRADDNLGPGRLGWGATSLLGITQNRSLEAHLANYGIIEPRGQGKVSQDPGGYPDTIDPRVDVLRVDKMIGGRDVPVGMWSTFADHGTVLKPGFHFYNGDHLSSAMWHVEQAVRRAGHVPAGQDVVNAYGNSDEGDVSAGLYRSGTAAANWVGMKEAGAMLAAWRSAGAHLTAHPAFDWRWTRVCFCGQAVPGGKVDVQAVVGLPLTTGSEEGRGPLYDVTQHNFEGDHLASDNPADPAQGDKIPASRQNASVPQAVPLLAIRIADRMIVSVPGEPTVGVGKRLRAEVARATRGSGVRRVVISGLANEYLSYFTTPQEYEQQHYEGGSTLYGEFSSNLIIQQLADLASRLAQGKPAQQAYAYDPRNGVRVHARPFPTGARRGVVLKQPGSTRRSARARFAWRGGKRGYDRPLGRAFVSIRRLVGGRWRSVADDLGLEMLWGVDNQGRYTARWDVPLAAQPGRYDFVVTANHYRLVSKPFAVSAQPVPQSPAKR